MITAVQNGAIYPVPGSLYSTPGPRLALGLEDLARILHPDRFRLGGRVEDLGLIARRAFRERRVVARNRRPSAVLVLGTLTMLLALALLFAAAFGAVQLRPDDLLRMTLNHLLGARFAPTWRPQDEAIFFSIRLPRVAGAALVGAALASAGVLFQGLLRNPLADPYALGVSGGAALGGALGFLLTISFSRARIQSGAGACLPRRAGSHVARLRPGAVAAAARRSSPCCWPASRSARSWATPCRSCSS